MSRFDWRTDVWQTYVHTNIAKSKSAQWNLNKLDRTSPFRIAKIYAWIKGDGGKYHHTRLTLACAILPTIKGSSIVSLRKLNKLKSDMISAEVQKAVSS